MLGELRVQVPRDVSTCQDDDSWPQVGSVRVSHESASIRQPHPKSFFQRLGRVLLGTDAIRSREPFSKDASQGWRCSIGSWGYDKERFAGA